MVETESLGAYESRIRRIYGKVRDTNHKDPQSIMRELRKTGIVPDDQVEDFVCRGYHAIYGNVKFQDGAPYANALISLGLLP